MESLQLVATSTMGLESIVARELKALGFDPKNAESGPGRTYFTGALDAVVKANIHLRCAGKVLIELASFPCEDFDVLFDAASAIPWEDWAPRNAKVVVEGRSVRSKITSVPALQRTVKKAIVNRLMNAYKTTTLPEDGALYTVEISLLKDQATITLDTTGRGLHRRGYRLMNIAAPLRETLAAGLVLLSNWEPGAPLIDPFCASGTIPIEAAMIGRNIAPGLKRHFDAQSWPLFPPKLWIEARKEAEAAILPPLEPKIIGTDIDAQALKFARQHAQLAGVENDIHFQQKDFADLTSQRHYGCVICNPPYGDRIGELAQLRPLYESMPAVFSRLPDWSFYIITAWNDFEKVIGQEATRRRKLYNSRIECTYFQFVGPKRPPKRVWEEKSDELETETPEEEPLDNSLDNSVTEAP
ncbi:MAG: class I SAM-dependent RNA methyltransferase, partial [Thermoguttaceae bacterium]|nr:class I SAM-dependent RNA methyltransferase [Thermoguttaceae bacterium]